MWGFQITISYFPVGVANDSCAKHTQTTFIKNSKGISNIGKKKISIKQCLHIKWKGFSEKANKRTFDIDVVSAVCGHAPRFTHPLPPATLQQTEDEWDL